MTDDVKDPSNSSDAGHSATRDMREDVNDALTLSDARQAKIEALEKQLHEEHAKTLELETRLQGAKTAISAVEEQLREEQVQTQLSQHKADELEQTVKKLRLRDLESSNESGAGEQEEGPLIERVAKLMLEREKLQSSAGKQALLIKQLQVQVAHGKQTSEARSKQAAAKIQELERNVTVLAQEKSQTQQAFKQALIEAQRDVDRVMTDGVRRLNEWAELYDKQEAYGRSLEEGLEKGRRKLLGHRGRAFH